MRSRVVEYSGGAFGSRRPHFSTTQAVEAGVGLCHSGGERGCFEHLFLTGRLRGLHLLRRPAALFGCKVFPSLKAERSSSMLKSSPTSQSHQMSPNAGEASTSGLLPHPWALRTVEVGLPPVTVGASEHRRIRSGPPSLEMLRCCPQAIPSCSSPSRTPAGHISKVGPSPVTGSKPT